MPISAKDLLNQSSKDTYIYFMPESQRQQALKDRLITDEDIKRVGPALTDAEKTALKSRMSLPERIFLYSVLSMAKIDMDLDKVQKDLSELQNDINDLNKIMAQVTELNAKDKPEDRKMIMWDPRFKPFLKTLKRLQDKYGKEIDIEIFTSTKKGGGLNPTDGIPANIATEKLNNISKLLDNKVKTITTEFQKLNNLRNTILETGSFSVKKVVDTARGMFSM
ncbi:MAG: hypothetical protein C5B43_00385 [Verrucomicrobia bacterium]|nr:MAG: hypothetical protein C5B43_00385 [Verrucomicrobiota bacterium]